jgi:hypothetical protein
MTFELETLTASEMSRAASRMELQKAKKAEQDAIATGLNRRLIGDSREIDQGKLFADDEDLFQQTSYQSKVKKNE